ncbi:GntR family transcriptional regulator [Flagellimonas pacifica]|uniref:Transcriptional regulator, GntR family n=1 Tax=Flagellimonas pacifica TaxID=1247520 RepID=A0A285MCI3_9FLAO|nr:substrate-binding domain-containing protein [Allomuricauda parva]SNY94860.1 transcriptional regulator, GntR family [Allomuricauda parva]
MTLIDKIIEFKKKSNLTKHEHLVLGTIEAIDDGVLNRDDKMPSINLMIKESGYSRKTIYDAYEELKKRGLIESKMGKGYFVSSDQTAIIRSVALLLFTFQRFQQEFYNAFRKELGDKFRIDVYFHHNNIDVFKSILANIKSKYGYYVIAPIQNPSLIPLLEQFDHKRMLIVDRYLPLNQKFSFISQEFEDSIYSKLIDLIPDIKKYKAFIMYFKPNSILPVEILHAFKRFSDKYEVHGIIEESYEPGGVEKGNLYFCVDDNTLWDLLRDASQKEYEIGKDVGVLTLDDHIVKEMIHGGLTSISSDFKEMGRKAAKHIKSEGTTREFMSLSLIKRKSL